MLTNEVKDLSDELKVLYNYLQCYKEVMQDSNEAHALTAMSPSESTQQKSTLDILCRVLALSEFERTLLLLCFAAEIDRDFGQLYAIVQADEHYFYPTLNLASILLQQHQGIAFRAMTKLREWQLIVTDQNIRGLFYQPIRLTEWALQYLLGDGQLDKRLSAFLQPIMISQPILDSEQKVAEQIIKHWQSNRNENTLSIIQLLNQEKANNQQIASLVAQYHEVNIYSFNLLDLSYLRRDELDSYKRLLEREVLFQSAIYWIDCECLLNNAFSDVYRIKAILEFLISSITNNCILWASQPLTQMNLPLFPIYLDKLEIAEHIQLWQHYFQKKQLFVADIEIAKLVKNYRFNRQKINQIVQCCKGTQQDQVIIHVQQQCRQLARKSLASLAHWIQPKAVWQDLILSAQQLQMLDEFCQQFIHKNQVYEEWGFAQKSDRNSAMIGLFYGPSGTGKTLTAEVLANRLKLDLLHVDLSQVINKYIGDTEKNLDLIFSIAEESNALLLFDEADALFGKRTQITDSKDRYANISISYLLQRIEAFQGLVILTTNFKSSVDNAFLRRFRLILEFKAPGNTELQQIWRNAFPPKVPLKNIDYDKLSEIPLSGGQVHIIALKAAFKAAVAKKTIDTSLILNVMAQEAIEMDVSEKFVISQMLNGF